MAVRPHDLATAHKRAMQRRTAGAALAVACAAACGCDRTPRREVATFEACTSRSVHERPSEVRACGRDDDCLLMALDAGTPGGHQCVRRCRVDRDCAALGAGFVCRHAISHGPDYGCVRGAP